MNDPNRTIRRAEGVAYRELSAGEGSVLLRLDTGQYHGLNETGRLIWELVGDGTTLRSLVDSMSEELSDPPDSLARDIESFVGALIDRGLLVIEDQP